MKAKFPDLKILPQVFEKYSDIQAVYLFGSVASEQIHAESDIDLAIAPRDKTLRSQKLDILADLTKNGFNSIDLVFLDTPDILVRFEAVRQNQLIYCRPNFDPHSFYSLTLRQYFDFLPYLKVQRQAHKQRIFQHG
ncbi:MAG: type VII toxin-antitoxin system MntA family adenylyltransferase antitoxin [Anaerolineales bacterium]